MRLSLQNYKGFIIIPSRGDLNFQPGSSHHQPLAHVSFRVPRLFDLLLPLGCKVLP